MPVYSVAVSGGSDARGPITLMALMSADSETDAELNGLHNWSRSYPGEPVRKVTAKIVTKEMLLQMLECYD